VWQPPGYLVLFSLDLCAPGKTDQAFSTCACLSAASAMCRV